MTYFPSGSLFLAAPELALLDFAFEVRLVCTLLIREREAGSPFLNLGCESSSKTMTADCDVNGREVKAICNKYNIWVTLFLHLQIPVCLPVLTQSKPCPHSVLVKLAYLVVLKYFGRKSRLKASRSCTLKAVPSFSHEMICS